MSNFFSSDNSFLGSDIQQSSWIHLFVQASRASINDPQGRLGLSPDSVTPPSMTEREGHWRQEVFQSLPPAVAATRPNASSWPSEGWPGMFGGFGFPNGGGFFDGGGSEGGQGQEDMPIEETVEVSIGTTEGSLATGTLSTSFTTSSSSSSSSSSSTTSCVDQEICEENTDSDYVVEVTSPYNYGTNIFTIDPTLAADVREGCNLTEVVVTQINCFVQWDCPAENQGQVGGQNPPNQQTQPPVPGPVLPGAFPTVDFEVPDECCVNIPGVEITVTVLWEYIAQNDNCNCKHPGLNPGDDPIFGYCTAHVQEVYELECCTPQIVSCNPAGG